MSEDVLVALRALDTPTVCNALEVVAPQRRTWGYTTVPLVCPWPHLEPMVGYARTATVSAMHASGRDAEGDSDTRLAYYRHIAEGDGPTVTVIEDVDPQPGYGAWWGEVNSNVHKGLGSLGVVTNGSIRDIDDWADGFQALAGSIGPSHAFIHVVEHGIPVTVAGMRVRPGDLIHADRHGAVVVPPDVAATVPAAAARIAEGEAVLISASQQDGFDIDALERIVKGEFH